MVHAINHSSVDEILSLGNDDVEECLNQSLEQRPSSGEIPSDSHLIEFDLLIDIGQLKKVCHLLSFLPVEELRKLLVSIDIVEVTSD